LPEGTGHAATDMQDLIVPARTLSELGRVLGDVEGDVAIIAADGGTQVIFHTESLQVISRLIDGRFPDYERIIPTEYKTRIVLGTQGLIKAVKLASCFADVSYNIVKLKMSPCQPGDMTGKLIISINAPEVGDNRGEIDGAVTGDGGQLALNVKFLLDTLSAIKTAQVALESQDAQSPGVLKPVGDDSYTQVIMPMTIR
jgi:DNA polymerase-3 subunit beta